MAYEMPFKSITGHKDYATDLSQGRYKFVDIDASGNLKLADAGALPVGVLQEPGEANKGPMALQVLVAGVYPVIAGEAIATGDKVSVGAGGVAMKATDGVVGTSLPSVIVGKCLTGGAKDAQIAVLLK